MYSMHMEPTSKMNDECVLKLAMAMTSGLQVDADGNGPLHHAVMRRNLKHVRVLLEDIGENLYMKNKAGLTPAGLAGKEEWAEGVLFFAELQEKHFNEALQGALRYSKGEFADQLLEEHPEVKDPSGELFALACQMNGSVKLKEKVAKKLIPGTDPNAVVRRRIIYYPLVMCASEVSTELAEALIDAGADVNKPVKLSQENKKDYMIFTLTYKYLGYDCSNGLKYNFLNIKSLDFNIVDDKGNTYIFYVCRYEDYLINKDINFNHRNNKNQLFWEYKYGLDKNKIYSFCRKLVEQGKLLPENCPPKPSRCCIM